MKLDDIVIGMTSALAVNIGKYRKGSICTIQGCSPSTGKILIYMKDGKPYNCLPEQLIGVMQ